MSSSDVRENDPKFNNVLMFDDLMAQATDSPLVSLLFTQGRHRNASLILLLQNIFPKGKFNAEVNYFNAKEKWYFGFYFLMRVSKTS